MNGVPVLDGHLDRLQMCVHGHVHTGDGAVDLRAVLQLHRDRLMAELHQEPGQRMFWRLESGVLGLLREVGGMGTCLTSFMVGL